MQSRPASSEPVSPAAICNFLNIPALFQAVFGIPPRWLVLGLVVAVVCLMGINTVWRAAYAQTPKTDFNVYTAAGQAVLDGSSIYDAKNVRGWYYNYAPVFAVAMVPLALIDVSWASLIWYLLSVAMLGHGAWVSARLAKRYFPDSRLDMLPLCIGAVLLLWWPIGGGIGRGQVSVLLMYLLTMSVWFYHERRYWPAGLCLAAGTVLKIFPALMIVYILLKWRPRMLASTLLWCVVLLWGVPGCVFGLRGNQALLNEWLGAIISPSATGGEADDPRYEDNFDPRLQRNQSVQAVALRWIAGRTKELAVISREPLARNAGIVICGVLLLTSAWVCRRGRAEPESLRTVLELSLVMLLALLVSPISWNHYQSILLLPITLVLAAAGSPACRGRHWQFHLALIAFAIGGQLAPVFEVCNQFGSMLLGALPIWGVLAWALHEMPTSCAEQLTSSDEKTSRPGVPKAA